MTKDVTALLGYIFVVTVVNQLGTQRRRLAELAEKQRDELAHEIQLAAEVQQSILPRSIPTVPGFEFAARMYPAKIVAGDYYGFIELPEGEIGLVIADVSGKGVAAGLLMPSIEVALRMDAPRSPGTKDLLRRFNKVVCQITGGNRFISLFYGKLCLRSHSLEYTNAGHNPPLLIRDGLSPIALETKGVPYWACFLARTTRQGGSISISETSSSCIPMELLKPRIQKEKNILHSDWQGSWVLICNSVPVN
jgi:serine phosphatase RsbU (regulator of sigma subunit)